MDQTATYQRVVNIVKPFVKNPTALESAAENTRLLEDLGVNSARLVDIILAFEDEFGIAIDDASADQVRTLGDAVKVVMSKTVH